ncbi:PREDICTED: uncharacterized protein LOC108361542, partial [Rhagoletis zephyria]|uniref:uncharacterized protein LOC108361542 n=1 Tax=Rhagoletis zephyria TaxID=28612 RepID=UPI0008116FFA
MVLEFEFYQYFELPTDSQTVAFNYSCCNFAELNNLFDLDWSQLFGNVDVTGCYDIFKSKLCDICVGHIPILNSKTAKRPWFTKELKRISNKKNKFYKRQKHSNDVNLRERYVFYRAEFNRLNKSLYRNYIRGVESNIKSNPKFFWSYIKSKKNCSNIPASVQLNGVSANSISEAVNLFVDFFSSNFISGNSDNDFILLFVILLSNLDTPINFGKLKLTDEDVANGINQLKLSTNTDVDGLSVILFKSCPSLIAPLRHIFNMSLSAGVFLDDWKLTFITPILKSGNKNCIENYRPISKLTTVSKLFESIVKDKIYFAVKHLLCPNQHGFVPGRSTLTNLAPFTEDCLETFQKGFQIDAIYTDFSKAFDR